MGEVKTWVWRHNGMRVGPESVGRSAFVLHADHLAIMDKLKGYAWHLPGCHADLSNGYNQDGSLKYGMCTCGLTEVLKEME